MHLELSQRMAVIISWGRSSVMEVGLVHARRLRQAVLRSAFEGGWRRGGRCPALVLDTRLDIGIT